MNDKKTPDTSLAWSVGGYMRLGLIAMGALFFGFGGWATFSTLAGAVVATGQIEVDRNRQAIQHPDGGVVAALFVDEGDRVDEGQILIRLDPARLQSDLTIARAQLFEVGVRRARLEAERDGLTTIAFAVDLTQAAATNPEWAEFMEGQADLFNARQTVFARETEQLRGRIIQIDAQVTGLNAQEAAAAEQLSLVEQDLARQNDLLERGLVQADPILRLQRDVAQIRGTLGNFAARKAELAERVIETELSITQLCNARVEEAIAQLREIRITEEELRARAAELSRQIDELDLRAPVAGTIHGLQIFGPQSVLRSAEPVAFLVPEGRPLIISTQIPATDIDQVFVGQMVVLRFPAFDMRNIPDLVGQVTQVSADAFLDETTGANFYRAEIVIDDGEITRLGDRTLLPGMPVEAYIRTEDRSPFAYLVEPIAAYFNRAFRET